MKKIILLAIVTLLLACTERESASTEPISQNKPVVMTTNYPLYFFTSEIAGDGIEVIFPVIKGDPAMWAPTGPDVAKIQNSDLLILNGADYESWLAFTSLPAGHGLDTTAQVQSMLLPIENETVHQHGPAGEHSHQGTAFTTWLDPRLAIEQSRAIMQGLSHLSPEQSGLFETNFEALKQKLLLLDQSMAIAFSELGEQAVIYSHPVYQYLQHRYDINGRSVHWEPDVELGTKEWIDFGNLLRKHPAKLMIWEDVPFNSVRKKLDQIGVQVIVFSPSAITPANGDYFSVMEQNLVELRAFTK